MAAQACSAADCAEINTGRNVRTADFGIFFVKVTLNIKILGMKMIRLNSCCFI